MSFLLDDLRAGSGFYLYDLVGAPDVVDASGAGVSVTATASTGLASAGSAGSAGGAGVSVTATAAQVIGYSTVTIQLPVFTGFGSIFYGSNFVGTPQNGDIVRYPTINGFRILSDGNIESQEYGVYPCYYNDGGGDDAFTVTLDANADVYASGVTVTAQAPDVSLYGGVNIEGDAPDVTATPATGGAQAGNIAQGQGITTSAAPASGGAAGGGAASGAGVQATPSAPPGFAQTQIEVTGAGVTAPAAAAQATATGDLQALGAGVTVQASAAQAAGDGDSLPGTIPYATMFVVFPRASDLQRAA